MSRVAIGNQSQAVANSFVTVYEVPATVDYASVSVNIANFGTAKANVKVFISMVDSPPNAAIVEPNAQLDANGGVLLRSYDIIRTGEKLVVYSDVSDVAIRVSGIGETK